MRKTLRGYNPFICMSAMQKCIRRGLEEEAMLWALEMCYSSKAYFTMTLNRLRVITIEDVGLADMQTIAVVTSTLDQLKEKRGQAGWRLMLGFVIMALSRADKSRDADHFCALTIKGWDDNGPGEIPDFAIDQHTYEGKAKGRGMKHFIEEGSKVVPDKGDNRYKERWKKMLIEGKYKRGKLRGPEDLFGQYEEQDADGDEGDMQ